MTDRMRSGWSRCLLAAVSLLVASSIVDAASGAAAAAAKIEVDAREAPRGIMSAHLLLPVSEGPLTLVYPKWLPGRHSPAGPLTSLGGPRFTAGGRTLPWRRDSVDLAAIAAAVLPSIWTSRQASHNLASIWRS